ncbi:MULTISPECIES: DNA primase [unclassified Ruminococcus]|uniref:DNA primase n=1 Tax=Ruminococcus sp. zg-921 TaxID=2678506 RepID=UPI002108E375|nr:MULTISPECIES: DNA primase [unclassified Ruminococcus]MCQ4022215.1 DNA primase [Ruminococcus sp. zg-924]MCQ4115222.1 DNA primase [Ruminococcus sp. zg-921]
MPLPDEFLDELKARSDISDIASSYVSLKRRGRNLVGLCPFHGEKTPSFNIYPENGSFYCFGCGAGGDVITFVRRIENLDYIEAVKFLAQRAGMEMPESSYDKSMSDLRRRVYEANREAGRFYYSMLYTAAGKAGLDYLRGRGLSEKTIKHFGLGFSPDNRFALVDYLRAKGFKPQELVAANLVYQNNNGNLSDRFYNRVMFPIIDLRGNVIAFGGRIMTDQKPKYLNTSDTPVFKKSNSLFALNFAKNDGKRSLILCEGYMDVIALHQAGFTTAVATLGTALTQEQAMLMKRYADTVYICYDSDEAGQKAAQRAIGFLRNAGIDIRVIAVPGAKDPDEFIRENGAKGPEKFMQLLEKSGNDIEYRISKIKQKYILTEQSQVVAYLTECAKLLATVESPIEADVYAGKISEETSARKEAVLQQINSYRKKTGREKTKRQFREIQTGISGRDDRINSEKAGNLRAARAEEALIAYIINNQDMAIRAHSLLPPEKMVTSFNRRVYKIITERAIQGRGIMPADISGEFTVDENAKIAGMLASLGSEVNSPDACEDCIRVILSEGEKITAEKAADADISDIEKYLEKLKQQKK